MIILGINAYHADASSAIVVDGQLIAAAEEERFCRVKHVAGFPTAAIRYCLEAAKVEVQSIDHIAINRNPRANIGKKAFYALLRRSSLSAIRDRLRNTSKVRDIKQELEINLGIPRGVIKAHVHHVEHHKAHLGSTFLVSPFDSAALASIDGFGDFVSTMVGLGDGDTISLFDRVTFPHSLGLFYLAMTQYLGFPRYGDEYKVMGLAAYGTPEYLDDLRRVVQLKPAGRFQLALEYFLHHSEGVSMVWDGGEPCIERVFSRELARLLGPPREKDEEITTRHKNLAASLQAMYEEAFFHILNDLYDRTHQKTLCLAGGCALNSVANGKLSLHTPFERVYVPPAAGDAGGAIGAAYVVLNEALGHPRSFIMDRADWGPQFDSGHVRHTLDAKQKELQAGNCDIEMMKDDMDLCRRTAQEIAMGKIVGWFQGRMEWGARALGYRSLLADPRRRDVKDLLNTRIKRRELFRPFAPSILEDAAIDYFDQTQDSPFMTMTYPVNPDKRSLIPAPIHVDGTGRLQTVNRHTQPLFWLLLKEFQRLTGIPILLNTSFNENEPIVCTPEHAIDCFLRTNMDVLAIGQFIVIRR